MIRKFNFTESQELEIIKQSELLLRYHNQKFKRLKIRFLSPDDESFLSGCKGNLLYGTQRKLSSKQLKRLSVIIKSYDVESDREQNKEETKEEKLRRIVHANG